ncbi:MAG: RsmD family RNA methyltransferase [Lentisphaeria bacterium]|nr:RsmD family RNA methyltransferase [Lentisphaeria bacterium]
MQIISGKARGVVLDSVDTLDIRPTSARARKALFDSLGSFEEAIVLDLCAGSGAMGLEAASRGAGIVYSVEKDARHVQIIERNIRKLQKTGVETEFQVIHSDILNMKKITAEIDEVDLIFGDPPYDISAELFSQIVADENFRNMAQNSLIVWEIPDNAGAVGEFIRCKSLFSVFNFRKFGSTVFLMAEF